MNSEMNLPDDRVVKEVKPPPRKHLSNQDILDGKCLPDWRLILKHFADGGVLSRKAAVYLITQAKFLFEREIGILEVDDPVTIIGDIHGQYYDLVYILESCSVESNKILFLGDYVDRGKFSIEVALLLFAIKINYPNKVIMLRGNHESRQMTTYFSFRKETIFKYDLEIYEFFMECFDCLPLACIVNKEIFAVHGGLSPNLRYLKDIISINRYIEPPATGILCDLLWSDPESDEKKNSNYTENKSRGCSFKYGLKAVKKFLKSNKMKTIIRAHEMQINGYKFHRWSNSSEQVPIITIFSAANYCDTVGNRGAFIHLSDSIIQVRQFNSNPHPFDLPNGMDAFTWSVPFVIDQVMNFFKRALQTSGENSPTSPSLSYSFSDTEPDKTDGKMPKVKEKIIKGLSKRKSIEYGYKTFLNEDDLRIINQKLGIYLGFVLDEYQTETRPIVNRE